MIRDWFKSSKIEQTHPTEEDLLRCVDGELSAKEAAKVRSHLETCWNCRIQLEKIEGTISAFVDFRQQIQVPLTQKPPKNWNDFDNKLKQLALEMPSTNKFGSGFFGGFGRFFRNLISPSGWSPMWKSTAVTALTLLLIFTIFWQFVFVRTVSANELLDKASQFQSQKINEVNQAVVYQKLRVRHQDKAEMNWEMWHDTTRSRFRQNVSNETNQPFNSELWQILQSNGFNPQNPLSAVTFGNWRKSLSQKSDTIEKNLTEDRVNLLVLKTVNLRADSAGKIIVGTLKVKEEDFHPVEQILQITTNDGTETYSFKELDFQIVSLSSLKPDFFPEPVTTQPASAQFQPTASPSPEANVTPSVAPSLVAENNNANLPAKKVEITNVAASADLEVEVLDVLNQAKADLGEQITVQREANGPVNVRGIVETQDRKNEILLSLRAFQNNPAVRIEIKTIDEAVAEQKNTPIPSGTAERVESQSSETAVDSELLAYFKTEQSARAFGGQMVTRSGRAMSRAYALKRLVGQFKPEELRQLSVEARAKWLSLIKTHARAFREETESLRRELQPAFDGPNVGASATVDVNDITAVSRAVASLLELASTNDRIVRSAFTISSGNARFTVIKTPQFWQSLKSAEALAAKLQSVK